MLVIAGARHQQTPNIYNLIKYNIFTKLSGYIESVNIGEGGIDFDEEHNLGRNYFGTSSFVGIRI